MNKKVDLMAMVLAILEVIILGVTLLYGEVSMNFANKKQIQLILLVVILTIPVIYLYLVIVFKRVAHSRYVYLSFCKKDSELALQIKEVLETTLNKYSRYRYEVLTGDDDIQYGDDMTKSVQELIHKSRAVVILASPGYISSEWCQFEFNTLDFEKQRIIPIVYDVEHNGGFGVLKQLPTDIQHIKGLHIDTNTTKTELEYNLVLVAKSIIRDLPNKKRVD